MSRRRAAVHRPVMKDPKYQDSLVSKFICSLMKDGKKGVAESILYGAMDLIGEREKEALRQSTVPPKNTFLLQQDRFFFGGCLVSANQF